MLVASLEQDAALSPLGQDVISDQLIGHLVNRLDIERCHREHTDIADQTIVAPLFGLGLPRTGSTALSFLMALDPARRSLRTWEAGHPCPPPETAHLHDDLAVAADHGADTA